MFFKASKLVFVSITLCLCLSPSAAQQGGVILYPAAHSIPGDVQAVNGSQENVGCTGTQPNLFVCRDLDPGTPGGNTSYLVDRNIPTSLDFSDNNWARELMTVNHNGKDSFDIRMNFDDVRATRVELVLFNCPDWGIGAVDISVTTIVQAEMEVGNFTLQNTSCDSLLTVCIPLQPPPLDAAVDSYAIIFVIDLLQTNWTHIAEVTFYDDNSTDCEGPVTAAPATEPTDTQTTTPTDTQTTTPTDTQTTTPTDTQTTTPTDTQTATPNVTQTTTPTDTQTTTSTDTQAATPTDTTATTSSSSSSAPGGTGTGARNTIIIVAVVIVVAIILFTVVSLIIVLCCYFAMRKRKHGIHEVEKLQSVLLEHKSLELSTIKPAQEDTEHAYDNTNPSYENTDVASSRHTWSGGKSHNVNSNEPVPVYSTVARDEHDAHTANEDAMYATVQVDEYAVVDKPPAPTVPEKSDDLQVYLDTKQDLRSEQPQLAKPITGELQSYDTVGFKVSDSESYTPSPREVPPASDDVYAEPDKQVSRVPKIKPRGSPATVVYAVPEENDGHTLTQQAIYEEVYSEPIKPSLFMQKQGTSEQTEEDLQPYGPIYTVPTAPAENTPIEVTSKNIKLEQELGDGNFGKVFLAKTVGLSSKDLKFGNSDDKKNASFLVAVKTLKSSASTANRSAFEKEYKFMSRLDHSNVIRILGICTSGDAPFIMMEYMGKGDLNQYLQEYTEIISSSNYLSDGQILTSTLLGMCIQIASAMQYLAAQNFVHRDLATRNCLVGDNNVIKIADFGMSRHLYDSHYYVIRGHAILPVRWMATECFYGLFSAKTDVWAFGVTMWEIFTLAKDEPYGDMTDQAVVEDAIKGEERMILEKPEACPQDVYHVMLRCWVHNSTDRATFEDAFTNLSAVDSQ